MENPEMLVGLASRKYDRWKTAPEMLSAHAARGGIHSIANPAGSGLCIFALDSSHRSFSRRFCTCKSA